MVTSECKTEWCVGKESGRMACVYVFFFFFNCTATTEIYPPSLHDALPIWGGRRGGGGGGGGEDSDPYHNMRT